MVWSLQKSWRRPRKWKWRQRQQQRWIEQHFPQPLRPSALPTQPSGNRVSKATTSPTAAPKKILFVNCVLARNPRPETETTADTTKVKKVGFHPWKTEQLSILIFFIIFRTRKSFQSLRPTYSSPASMSTESSVRGYGGDATKRSLGRGGGGGEGRDRESPPFQHSLYRKESSNETPESDRFVLFRRREPSRGKRSGTGTVTSGEVGSSNPRPRSMSAIRTRYRRGLSEGPERTR